MLVNFITTFPFNTFTACVCNLDTTLFSQLHTRKRWNFMRYYVRGYEGKLFRIRKCWVSGCERDKEGVAIHHFSRTHTALNFTLVAFGVSTFKET